MIGIDPVGKRVVLVQCKSGKTQKSAIKQVEDTGIITQFSGCYQVEARVV